jgi:hypothetical protein
MRSENVLASRRRSRNSPEKEFNRKTIRRGAHARVKTAVSTMTKVLIGGAVAAGAVNVWQIVKPALRDGGAQHRGSC